MVKVNGMPVQPPAGAIAYKYADPIEPARWISDRREAEAIEVEDPSLIVWVRPDDCFWDAYGCWLSQLPSSHAVREL